MDLLTFHARDIALWSEEDVWSKLPKDQKFTLLFDDGSIVTDHRRTELCWYCWWPLRDYPGSPITVRCHLGNRDWTTSSITELMNTCWWLCFEHHNKNINPEIGAMRIKQEISHFHNATITKLSSFVTSLDILAFYEVIAHPRIKEINDHLQGLDQINSPGVRANIDREISKAYKEVETILMTDPSLRNNDLVKCVRAGYSNMQQVLQIVCCRGKATDIDGYIFPVAITSGYAHGHMSLYDVLIDSRSAAKALSAQGGDLQLVEYFNRQLQLICNTLSTLDCFYHQHADGEYKLHDCGGTRHILWNIPEKGFGDVVGAYYFDGGEYQKDPNNPNETTGRLVPGTYTLKKITSADVHLIGKTVKLRTATTCDHPDEGTICAACVGDLEFSIPAGSNIGHVAAIILAEIVSQRVLSTKHLLTSATMGSLSVERRYAPYIRTCDSQQEFGIALTIDTDNTCICLSASDAKDLNDVHVAGSVNDLIPRRVAVMADVVFDIDMGDGDRLTTPVPVSPGTTGSAFTREFLKHIKTNGFEKTEGGSVRISLKGWDKDLPVWTMARKHASMLDFMKSIEKKIKLTSNDSRKDRDVKLSMDLTDSGNIAEALNEFYDLVCSKFNFSLPLLAIVLRATLVSNKDAGDYHVPQGGEAGEFGEYLDIMENRSMANLAGFERQKTLGYENSKSYTRINRPRCALDEVFCPTHSFLY